MDSLSKYQPQALGLLRIVSALLFIAHGTQKMFGWPSPGMAPYADLPVLLQIGAVLEIVGGLALVLGLFTRPVAFVLSGMMAVAYWMFHAPSDYIFPLNNGGDAAVLFCFVFLYLVTAGPGAWSLDAKRKSA